MRSKQLYLHKYLHLFRHNIGHTNYYMLLGVTMSKELTASLCLKSSRIFLQMYILKFSGIFDRSKTIITPIRTIEQYFVYLE